MDSLIVGAGLFGFIIYIGFWLGALWFVTGCAVLASVIVFKTVRAVCRGIWRMVT